MDHRHHTTESRRGDACRFSNESYLPVILRFSKVLHEADLRAPLPARSFVEKSLEIAMHQMRRLESDYFRGLQLGQPLPETRPQARRFDADIREISDFVGNLNLISEIGNENEISRGGEKQRARSGESGEIADVRQRRQEKAIYLLRRQALAQAVEPETARITESRSRPLSVNEYSTRTGVSGITVRRTIPSDSNSFKRSASMRSLRPGTVSHKSLKRVTPLNSARRIAPVQRRPISSTVRW